MHEQFFSDWKSEKHSTDRFAFEALKCTERPLYEKRTAKCEYARAGFPPPLGLWAVLDQYTALTDSGPLAFPFSVTVCLAGSKLRVGFPLMVTHRIGLAFAP
ncbi:MAG: hypothetical protein C5B50_15535, partial [Verrucomicrobia bacterium]